jgi:two-component system sensor histidine kinase KdpD
MGPVKSNIAAAELQEALLNSVSHNLRAPLASITGVLDSLIADRELLDETTQRELLSAARDEATRLKRLIRNLLDITRVEGGAVRLRIEPCDLTDAVSAALVQLENRPASRLVRLDIPHDLPPVPMDFALISQTLVNLIDNAWKYAGAAFPIEIRARREGGSVRVEVADRGRGFEGQDLDRIFDKFYSSGGQGIGLGLSICREFVGAHGGEIRAENRQGGGAVISFTLPMQRDEGGGA